MRFVRMRLLGAVVIALIASGILSGALGASAQDVSNSIALNTGAAAQAESSADAYGLAPIQLQGEAEYAFSPGANGVYAGYLFSEAMLSRM